MPNRHGDENQYKYGYQGSEKDDDVKGNGNSYTTEFRQLDVRIGRWLSYDPKSNANESPYVSMGNNPILNNDQKGDTVNVGPTVRYNEKYKEIYDVWASTKQGKKTLKDYGIGGKYEHISVNFVVKDIPDGWTDVRGNTKTEVVNKKTGIPTTPADNVKIDNATNLVNGKDKTSYLKFTIALDVDQSIHSDFDKAIAVNTIVHETQHMNINMKTLKSSKMTATGYQHHEWMSKGTWLQERKETFKQIKSLWEKDYNDKWKDKRNEDGYIEDKVQDYGW